jgi:hypothetical protein
LRSRLDRNGAALCNDTKYGSSFSWKCQPIFKTE